MRFLTLLALVVLPGSALAQAASPAQPTSATSFTLYVSSESGDIVTRIEVGPNGWRKVREIPVGTTPTGIDGPHNVAVSPDGRFWYVSIAHGTPFGSVWKYRTGSDSLIGTVRVGMFPTTIGLSPDGDWAFVPNSDFHGDRGHRNSISVVYTPDLTQLTEVPACDMPHGSRVSGSGLVVYIACMMSDELVTIDAGTFGITRRVPLGSGSMSHTGHAMPAAPASPAPAPTAAAPRPRPGAGSSTLPGQDPDCMTTYVALSPGDSLLYLACNHSNVLQVRNARTLELVRSLETGNGAYNVEPSPDGRWVVVTNKKAQSVSIFDTRTWREAARVATSKRLPHGIAFSPDGRYAFISVESVGSDPGAVDAIDLATLRLVASMEIPLQPTGIAVWRGN